MIFGTQSKCSIFQYYDIGLFSIAPHLVIAFPRERERERKREIIRIPKARNPVEQDPNH
jgi:hypothetical protein